jgi:hypothetical protein
MEMANAVPDHVMRDIARHGTIPGPSVAGASGTVTKVSTSPGLPGTTTGWRREIPLGPQPGIRYVDQMLDAADRADRVELARRIARQKAVEETAQKLASEELTP